MPWEACKCITTIASPPESILLRYNSESTLVLLANFLIHWPKIATFLKRLTNFFAWTVRILSVKSNAKESLVYPAGNLFIPVVHGRLEAILKEPRSNQTRGVALVLHPHPLGGGTMHNKVVFRAAATLYEAGLVTLRFNFRGVGQSTGAHDEGRGERDDARVALKYLKERYPGHSITLCGFS